MVRNLVFAISLLSLAGCDMFITEDEIHLPGKRISVLLNSRTIDADPELAETRILLPAPSPNTEWPQSGGYPNHAMHHMSISDNIAPLWKASFGSGATDETRLVSEPVASNGMVYTIDSRSYVSAINAENGKQVWSVALAPESEEDDGHISGGIAYYRNHVYVTTGFGDVVSLNAESGAEIWREYIHSPMRSAPTVRSGRVFVLTIDNRILALNFENGELLWESESVSQSTNLLGGASPAVDGSVVVVPYSSGELVAHDLETGRMLWSDSLTSVRRTDSVASLAHIHGNPIIDRGRVLAVSNAGIMASIDIKTGARIWDREIASIGGPWIAGDYIYMLTNDAEIICLSRDNGRVYWVRSLPQFEDPEDKEDLIIWNGPVLASDRLLITGSHGEAWALSPYTGDVLGSIELPDGVSVPPIIANGSVYFMADNATIVAYK
jgi:outer membrane protein assembly factor BamB